MAKFPGQGCAYLVTYITDQKSRGYGTEDGGDDLFACAAGRW